MADLGKAYVQIVPSAQGIKGQIENLLGGPASDAGASAGAKSGNALFGALKKVAGAAAIGKILKDSFEAGGNLEQSFGGLETIYGEASAAAKEYAVQAAQAGISANDYAEQAVSFGAALKQAYGGDVTAAMEAANTAIMDMADNSAKMGTDIGSIQAAYQGFAKQNYTMLDNLKLGYGGTKTEMERLLADATKLSGVEYNIDNLGDVYDAIHVIQGELGLTGVAAGEAETTLTGSFGAVKASWTNLMAAMTTGEGLSDAVQNLGKSAGNLLKNVVRMAGNVLSQLPTLISGIFNTIGPEVIPMAAGIVQNLLTGITTNLPTLLTGGMSMLLTIVQGISSALPQLVSMAATFIPALLTGIVSALPQLLSTGTQIITTLLTGLVQALPQLLSGGLQALMQFVAGVLQNLPALLTAGIEMIGELAAGAIEAIPTLIGMIPTLFGQFTSAFKSVDWLSLGVDIINGIINGITSAAGRLFDSLKNLASNALNSAKNALGIGSPSKLFADEIGRWIPPGVALGIDSSLPDLNKTVQNMINVAGYDFMRTAAAPPAYSAAAQAPAIDYDRLAAAISERPVQIVGDTNRIFKVVRETNVIRTKATNWNALGAATT